MTTRDKSVTERQFSLDSNFSSLSGVLCHKVMTSSFPSYDFKTPEIFTTSPKIDPTMFIYNPGPVKSSSKRPVIQHLNIPLLSHLEPHNTGFLSPLCLVHYWEGLGVEDGKQVLEDLGLSVDEERLDLRIVSQKLNDEIGHALEIVSYASVQAAVATLYDEVLIVRNTLDNATKERDKLRADMQEARKRAAVLAVEMDEQNYLNDKLKQEELQDLRQTWAERLITVEGKIKSEREAHETDMQEIRRNFDEEKTNFEDIHRRMEMEWSTLIKKNKKLEDELESKNEKLAELEELNSCLRKKREKPGHLLRIENCQEKDTKQPLIYDVEELVRVNKDLKDRNEELEINILVNSFTDCLSNSLQGNKMKRKGCHLPESPPSSSKSKVTKKNTEIGQETASPQTQHLTDVSESENDEDEVVSLSDIWCSFDQQYKVPSLNISKPGRTLEDELEHVNLDDLEEKIVKFKELKLDEETETNRLLENNKHLEESLELMQTEFESMEDYWQKKIDEERLFYEEQLKVSENQFKELEVRVKDCEELLTNMESSKHDSDTLYAIDEQRILEERVNEWEEEISHLKLQLEEMQRNHEEEVLTLKGQIFELSENTHHPRNLDTFNNTSYRKCFDYSSLKEKRKNLELSWTKVVELNSDKIRPLSPSSSSLPSYPTMDVEQEANRRQELRRYIEKDYDQMLLRKERRKICPEGEQIKSITESYSRRIAETNIVHCNVGTQAPQVAEQSCRSVTSSSPAFKAILCDISSQISLLESELSKLGPRDTKLQHTILMRLSTQASRCHQLHSSLDSKRAGYTKDMADMKEHQISEISHLEYLVISSQDLVRRQTKTYMEWMDKLVMMDTTMEQLMTDSQKLTEKIDLMKKRWHP